MADVDWKQALAPMLSAWDPRPEAAILVGSQVRGDATPWSDIDVVCVGSGPDYVFELTELGPVSWSFATADDHRAAMLRHSSCGQVVPAWRDALILHDPAHRARELVRFARDWTWDRLDPEPEVWAAGQVHGYAEEVLKLRKAVAGKDWVNARVQASILAVHLAPVIAAGTRTFFSSENHLWHLLADRLGADWREHQETALAADGAAPERSCAAAVELFRAACALVDDAMSAAQRRIVRYALDSP
ncbi:nucleotidyltransferase domain-containing protein [Actinophytocola gossypii]|uniref:Nucleotidyltransferase domain-containing protein n=1 Tax=Actinophytocola gossypii TaxID=2812003 RepID=A0ABT2JJS4_9PSEU|nr:nucleotidyltransferase domain-containing protein [Actinophytocola gossypii]MCT2587635.1 nucleotidyltransferase domain-containing protein [Actinophytocola gossypii]